jgi:hypothetical protein
MVDGMTTTPRDLLRTLLDAAVSAALLDKSVPLHLPPPSKGRTVVVGAGKASAAMARTLEDHWPGQLTGLVVTRYGHAVACERIEIVEASHPVSDAKGREAEVRALVGARANAMAKLEKPSAIECLDEIVARSDGIMVARGDLGVEMPPEKVAIIQRRILRACRKAGKPVIVATQMLEPMITTLTPTRAEASDVATAIYDGADAVTLSAESASGQFPLEAVQIMDRIILEA